VLIVVTEAGTVLETTPIHGGARCIQTEPALAACFGALTKSSICTMPCLHGPGVPRDEATVLLRRTWCSSEGAVVITAQHPHSAGHLQHAKNPSAHFAEHCSDSLQVIEQVDIPRPPSAQFSQDGSLSSDVHERRRRRAPMSSAAPWTVSPQKWDSPYASWHVYAGALWSGGGVLLSNVKIQPCASSTEMIRECSRKVTVERPS